MPEGQTNLTPEERIARRMTRAAGNLQLAIDHLNRVITISRRTVAERDRRGQKATEAEERIALALEELAVIREALQEIRGGHLPSRLSQYIRERPSQPSLGHRGSNSAVASPFRSR